MIINHRYLFSGICFILINILNLLDCITTYIGIEYLDCGEKNILFNILIYNYNIPVIVLMIIKFILFFIILFCFLFFIDLSYNNSTNNNNNCKIIFYLILILMYVHIVINNMVVLMSL